MTFGMTSAIRSATAALMFWILVPPAGATAETRVRTMASPTVRIAPQCSISLPRRFQRPIPPSARTAMSGPEHPVGSPARPHGAERSVSRFTVVNREGVAMRAQFYVLTLFLGVVLTVHLAMNGKVGAALSNPPVANALFW